ncbi:MAG: DUF3455 domain-containing protein [Pseudolabrys sp.]|nr:DUF3455 domain-containing protein [Pseudolabrys sp.]
MSQTFSARRHGDGTIDFDFYRTRAATLRGHAIRNAVTPKRARSVIAILIALPLVFVGTTQAKAELPAAIAMPGASVIATVNAKGAQVYECKADASGKLAWQFREPVATLLVNGRTVGWHYAGPGWEFNDGSAVTAKAAGRAPGATANDIPLLKLAVTSHSGSGQLTSVTAIQRLNTQGGTLEGACGTAGALTSVPYSADYTFVREPN